MNMMSHFGMMGGAMGISTCILMWILNLVIIGGVVYFAVKLALRNQKIN
jgi:hypothetical protein